LLDQLPFQQVWAVDFEFIANRGERPLPVCMVAQELRSGRTLRLWADQFGPQPPFAITADALFVAYYASAELTCFKVLGWPMPVRILDLYVEFRNSTNRLQQKGSKPVETGLLAALAAHGLDTIGAIEKAEMRALILRGGPWLADERAAILDYCESDVTALARLLPAMLPLIDLPRALLRGRYMVAVAAMEHAGTPIDVPTLDRLRTHWDDIQTELIHRIDVDYGVFDGLTFKYEKFEAWLHQAGLPWPRLESGKLDLSDEAFREAARAYPIVAPLRELRSALSELRLNDLQVGRDGRNRTLLSPFRARTSRNQPSNSKYIFGPAVWLRSLIKPPEGYGVAYIDFEQQEFGIAAALSGDPLMLAAYVSGDPYLAFAKQAGAVPQDATKRSHGATRELFKTCALAVQYGMGEHGLALRIGQPPVVARDLLRAHRETYARFWQWSDHVVDRAVLTGSIYSCFGVVLHLSPGANPRSVRNFPMQANGAEMLRLACCLATERGVEVCAPVHDAVLICAPLDRLEQDVATTQAAFAEASRVVLNNFELRSEAKVVCFPNRYSDARGRRMWQETMSLVERAEASRREAAHAR
jgi:DNA polymerase I